ncbi:MAG: antitoxin Xre/MbcA/ParS toxin-binding domain-containing protein [Weeksellaceae bacterium]
MPEERMTYGEKKQYNVLEFNNIVEEAAVQLQHSGVLNTDNRIVLMRIVRDGVDYDIFETLLSKYPFTFEEWSNFLHLSGRTLQRYKKDEKNFDSLQSEKILQITLLYQKGVDVFGDKANFDTWLNTPSIALGDQKPKELLDNAFGIALLDEELTRIEHGVLA